MYEVLTSNHTKAQFLNVGVIYLKVGFGVGFELNGI